VIWLQRTNKYDAWAGKSVDRMIREARRRRRQPNRRRAIAIAAVIGVSLAAIALGRPQNSPSPSQDRLAFAADVGAVPSALAALDRLRAGGSPNPPAATATSPSSGGTATPVPTDLILGATATPAPTTGAQPTAAPPLNQRTVTIVAAGDIACDPATNTGQPATCDQEATAALIGQLNPTAVITLGDNQYEDATLADFQNVYGKTWGAYFPITFPTIGEQEYVTSGAAGYFGYFDRVPAYYSFDLGAWHIVVLDSECHFVNGCSTGSPQETWLLSDLAAHPNKCTLVAWHEPRWSSGAAGDSSQMTTIWADIVNAHVDVVLSAHNNDYEHFVPLDAAGVPDPNGAAEFVVGTGGKSHSPFSGNPLPGEVARDDTSFGVLQMSLSPTGYGWRFVPAPTYSYTDSGSATCH
jgi:hypothetical protein